MNECVTQYYSTTVAFNIISQTLLACPDLMYSIFPYTFQYEHFSYYEDDEILKSFSSLPFVAIPWVSIVFWQGHTSRHQEISSLPTESASMRRMKDTRPSKLRQNPGVPSCTQSSSGRWQLPKCYGAYGACGAGNTQHKHKITNQQWIRSYEPK